VTGLPILNKRHGLTLSGKKIEMKRPLGRAPRAAGIGAVIISVLAGVSCKDTGTDSGKGEDKGGACTFDYSRGFKSAEITPGPAPLATGDKFLLTRGSAEKTIAKASRPVGGFDDEAMREKMKDTLPVARVGSPVDVSLARADGSLVHLRCSHVQMFGNPVVEIWEGANGKPLDDPKGASEVRASYIKVDLIKGGLLKCATDADSVFAAGNVALGCNLSPADR
jgi:hypothetical protein